jgi:stress response protein YsnF
MQQSQSAENGYSEDRIVDETTERVIQVGEETLRVDKKQIEGRKTTIRRIVLQRPASADVELEDQTVVVETREPVNLNDIGEVLSESSYDVHDTKEEPVVHKDVRVVQEVVIKRIKSVRVETISETVRYDEVKIERDGEEEPFEQQQATHG